MSPSESVTLGEVDRKVDRLESKVDGLVEAFARMKESHAQQAGRFQGGVAVIVFLGSIVGAIVGWFTRAQT